MRCSRIGALGLLVLAGLGGPARGTAVQPAELETARRWAGAKFEGTADAGPAAGYVVEANHDPVQRDARGGRPLNLAGTLHRSGLYCHATSRVVVRLPGPGAMFRAVVGVDSNEQTSGGRGSVVFVVRAGDEQLYRSPLLREGMPGVPVAVELDGATQLILEVEDGGDGITCDQADWAEARVTLRDGAEVRLGDLDEIDPARRFTAEIPFAFTYGGRPSADLLAAWPLERTTAPADASGRARHTLTWTDPETKLEVRCEATTYAAFPVVEWTVWFRNAGGTPARPLADVRALDAGFLRPSGGEWVLHYHEGSTAAATDYRPFAEPLPAGAAKRFAPRAGRACDPWLPYFNLEGPGAGLIMAVGWPGQWEADFARDAGAGLRVRAGQEAVSLVLAPGESIRTPLLALLFYRGDAARAQNVWRRWMLAHNVPRPGGALPPPHLAACSSHQFGEMIHADEASQIRFIDRYLEEGLKLDYWWMDAGWYVNRTGWPDVGTWEVDRARFPRGLRAITDHARAKGVRSIVWFEPERVVAGTKVQVEHPDWVLLNPGGNGILDLGNDAARAWLTGHVAGLIGREGIDLYRQDFNIDPLPFWRAADATERRGWAENRHVRGYLAYWDDLRKQLPDMLIDSCASGGRRNDLETLRRAVPLLRSDYIIEPIGQQNHLYGIASWMPYHGTGINSTDPYVFRSQMGPHLNACYDVRRTDLDYDALRTLYRQWLEIRDLYFADYYPLTPYDPGPAVWLAWQYDVPERGRGFVQAFRRPDCVYEAARLPLRGLDPDAEYEVRDLDAPDAARSYTGRELTGRGLPVTIAERPGAVVLTYRKRGE